MAKLRALLVGATGVAGQQFVSALRDHPWFEIGAIAASPRNAGKRYDEAVSGAWFLPEPIPAEVAAMRLLDPGAPVRGVDLVFSAVESDVARELEPRLAADIPVISAASAFRYEDGRAAAHPAGERAARAAHRQQRRARLQGLHRAHPQLHHHRPGDHARAARRALRRPGRR